MAMVTVKRPAQALGDGLLPSKKARVTRAQTIREAVSDAASEYLDNPVHSEPPVWAECRPDLCDALPYFRAVQGGVYHHDGLAWGFLLDADCGIRSHIDDEIIITRIGGGCIKDAEGKLVLTKDQDSDSSMVNCLTHSKAMKHPVGLIIGDRNTLLGRKLPHRYNVMGFFLITDIWYERVGNKKGGKIRFQKLDLFEKSWWSSKDSPAPLAINQRNFEVKPEVFECEQCSTTSQRIYNEGLICLNPSCEAFWTVNGSAPVADLTFHSNFLNARAFPDPEIQPHHELVPDLLSTINEDNSDVGASRIIWKGIICPQCQKCISRRFWSGWKCTDPLGMEPERLSRCCTFEKTIHMQPISLRSVIDDFELGPVKRAIFFDPKFSVPTIDDQSVHPYRKLTYTIRGLGSITHFVSNKAINSRSNGPNDLFTQLQVRDLGLRRYPLQQSVVAETLTAHFAVNYGMPYKYVVSVDSKGFNEASDEILRAMGRLSWATEKAVSATGDAYLPPNELLMLGYFEDMKIGYHDDGESSLGPTIATLSLGAKSTMFIRMKYKYYHGYSKSKRLLDEDPVLEGCKLETQRQELKDLLTSGQITRSKYDKSRKDLLVKGKNGEAPPSIKMELNHGDLVVMHGENLQKYFEHSVVPEKKLRFALTARYIKPEHIEAKDLGKGEFTLTPDQIYDGK